MIPWYQFFTYRIGFLTLHVWGTFVALGILIAIYIIYTRAPKYHLEPETMLDLVIWLIVGGFLGARLGHIFFYEPTYYLLHPAQMIMVWKGGLSSFGGFIGAGIALCLFIRTKKIMKRVWLPIADLMMFGALYGWIIARFGCASIHDHPGIRTHFFLAIQDPSGPRLEMAILEILGLIPIAIWFFVKRKQKMWAGWFTATLSIYYGVLRFILDFFRATDVPEPDARYFGLTPAQYLAIVLVAIGIWILVKHKKNGEVA